MVMNLKVFLAVLVSLALVGCPGEEGDDEGDYTLKVGSIDDIEVGKDFSVTVEIQSDKKTVVEGDGATLEVTVAVNCTAKETADKDERKEVKPAAKKAAKGKVTITGTADASWKAEDSCTAKATAKGAKEAEGKFNIKAASTTEPENPAVKPPEFPTAITAGQQFSITNGTDKTIKLINNAGENCTNATNFLLKITVASNAPSGVEDVPAAGVKIKASDKFVVIGNTCSVSVTDIDDAKTVTAGTGNPGIGDLTTSDKLGFAVNVTEIAKTGTKHGFIKTTGTPAVLWTKIAAPFPTSAGNWLSETNVDGTAANNHVLFNIGDKWSYKKGG